MVHVFSLPYCVLPLNEFHESVFFPVWHSEILLQALIGFIFSISFLYFLIAFFLCVCTSGSSPFSLFIVFISNIIYFPIFTHHLLCPSTFKLCLFCYLPLHCAKISTYENKGLLLQTTIDFMYTEKKLHFLHRRQVLFSVTVKQYYNVIAQHHLNLLNDKP